MRIVFCTHYVALMGANRSLLHLVEALKKSHGVEVLVFCPKKGPFTEALEQKGINHRIMPFANWAYTIRSRALYSFPWLWKTSNDLVLPMALEEAERFRPHAIHSNSQAVSLGWQLAEAMEVPHVWHIREFGWKDYQLVFPLGKALWLEKLGRAARLICISRSIQQAVSEVNAPNTVIYNGIGPLDELKRRSTATRGENQAVTFLIIGQLQPGKGQHEALEAFARVHKTHPETRLVVAGTGRRLYTLRLKLQARLLGITGAVTFTGYVPDPDALYAASDVVLMCSRNEAMGRVTAEAMSYGKAVVAFRGGATPELITHGKNGLLYETMEAFVQSMNELVQSPERRALLGRQAADDACARFSDEAYADAVFQIYRECIKKQA